ncbi:MAG: hypothetical protein K8F91_24480, partial [Candidatus Obscuribacterales bacterium]|nr:hypothetical protein [Candidatus Obscuribacterales bacterium]
ICKEDFAECLEIALFKGKDFGEVLEERGLATRQHMKAAKNLLSSIGAEVVKPYEAALCLNRICRHGEKLYTAITDIHKQRQVGFGTRLGELLVRAGLIAQEEIEKIVDCGAGSSIRLGSALLNTGLISEGELYAALRLQSSVRLGYLEATRAVEILDYLRLNQVSLDKAMVELHVYVPSRMQWAWV